MQEISEKCEKKWKFVRNCANCGNLWENCGHQFPPAAYQYTPTLFAKPKNLARYSLLKCSQLPRLPQRGGLCDPQVSTIGRNFVNRQSSISCCLVHFPLFMRFLLWQLPDGGITPAFLVPNFGLRRMAFPPESATALGEIVPGHHRVGVGVGEHVHPGLYRF